MKKLILCFYIFSATSALGYSITYKKGYRPVTVVSGATAQSIDAYVNGCANMRTCINSLALIYTFYESMQSFNTICNIDWNDIVPPVETQYCNVLGVSDGKNYENAHKEYLKLSRAAHPDKNTQKDTTEQFQRLSEAKRKFKDRDEMLNEINSNRVGIACAGSAVASVFFSLQNWLFGRIIKKIAFYAITTHAGVECSHMINPGKTVSYNDTSTSVAFAIYDMNGKKLCVKEIDGSQNYQFKIDRRGNVLCEMI